MGSQLEASPEAPCDAAAGQVPPLRAGPYRLTRLIGAGALGSVFRGERCDGLFAQIVAIKLLKPGLLADADAGLFATERRTLARLQHPNIARLLDGGLTDDGLSYIVMEYLEGVPITKFAATNILGARSRLTLFRAACLAVQHAHQNLVAHGDLSSSSVLVTPAGDVKVLDFGIPRLRDAATAQAPERMRGAPATATSDLWSLARILKELMAAEPTASGRLNSDLQAIVAKAMAARCEDRYASVAELIDDLDRHLDSRAVRARPPTWRYLTGRLIARHRWIVAGVTTALGALLVGGIVATMLYLRAERLTAQATTRFDDVRHMANFMLFDLYDRMGRVPGSVDVRRELADRGRTYLETLANIPGASPDLLLEAAEGHARLGEVLGSPGSFNLGQPQSAKKSLAVAQRMLETMRARQPARNDLDVALARVLLLRAAITSSMDFDAAKATQLAESARRLCEGVLRREPNDMLAMLLRWRSQNTLGNALGWQNRMPEVADLMRVQLASAAAMPATPQYVVERTLLEAGSRNMLGDALYYTDDLQGSLASYRQAAAGIEAARRAEMDSAHPQADDPRYLEQLGLIYWNEGGLLSDMNRDAEAHQALSRSTEVLERSIDYGSNERTERLLQSARLQQALVLSKLGRHQEAIVLATASVANREQRLAAQPNDRERHRDLAVGLRPLGDIYESAKQSARACAAYQRAQESWTSIDQGWGIAKFDRDVELKLLSERTARCGSRGS